MAVPCELHSCKHLTISTPQDVAHAPQGHLHSAHVHGMVGNAHEGYAALPARSGKPNQRAYFLFVGQAMSRALSIFREYPRIVKETFSCRSRSLHPSVAAAFFIFIPDVCFGVQFLRLI